MLLATGQPPTTRSIGPKCGQPSPCVRVVSLISLMFSRPSDGWVYLKVMGIRGYSCFWWGITERGHNSWLSSQNMLPKMTTGTSLGNWRFFVNLDTTQTSSISWEHVNIVVRCSFPVSPARFVLKKERKSGTFHIEVRKDKSSKIATYFFKFNFSLNVWPHE